MSPFVNTGSMSGYRCDNGVVIWWRTHLGRWSSIRHSRPGRTETRVLFAFEPKRRAIPLVGGDKSGNWSKLYKVTVPIADERFDAHMNKLEVRKSPDDRHVESKRRRNRR